MEDWTDITTASWDGVLSAAELSVIAEIDRTRELTKFASEVQTMIRSHSPNTVSADPLKIPSGFIGRALLVVRNRLLTSIPNYTIDDDRRKQGELAEAWFLRVADGKIRPEPAVDAIPNDTPNSTPSPKPKISARSRRFSRDQQDGI